MLALTLSFYIRQVFEALAVLYQHFKHIQRSNNLNRMFNPSSFVIS